MDFKDEATGKIPKTVKFNNSIDTILPKRISKAAVNSMGIIFSHEVKVIDDFRKGTFTG